MRTPLLTPEIAVEAGPSIRRTGLWYRIHKHVWAYLYLAPMLVLMLTFVVYPIFASLGYTLYEWNGIGDPTVFVGLSNFQQVMHDSLFWGAFLHTFVYTAVLVPVQLTLALVLALILNNPKFRFSTFYRTIYFFPVVTSPAVVGVVIGLIITNFGDTIARWLMQIHLIHSYIDWLGDPHFALGIIIVVGIWQGLGYNLVYFLAALQTIPAELYEAAKIDGANAFACFLYVTIPMLRRLGLMILLLAILGSLQVFDLVQVLTGGGPAFATEVVNTYIFHQAFAGGGPSVAPQPHVGFASAAAFFYSLLLLALAGMQVGIFRTTRRNKA